MSQWVLVFMDQERLSKAAKKILFGRQMICLGSAFVRVAGHRDSQVIFSPTRFKGRKWAQINVLIMSKSISSISAAWHRWIVLMWIDNQQKTAQKTMRKVFGKVEFDWQRFWVAAVFSEWKQIYAKERFLRLEKAELERKSLQVAC